MSDEPPDRENSPSDNRVLLSALGWVGVIALFLAVVAVTYLRDLPGRVDASLVEERHRRLAELRASEVETANSYAWIDREKGVIRIPVERAIEITVRELSSAQTTSPAEETGSDRSK